MKFYILAPQNGISGGPELLHQLASMLTEKGIDAKMAYYNGNGEIAAGTVPEPYRIYGTQSMEIHEDPDKADSVVIIPEGAVILARQFSQSRIIFWWLSVNNYTSSWFVQKNKERYGFDPLNMREHPEWGHMCQSMYAIQFLRDVIKIPEDNIAYLSDYINDAYLEEYPPFNRKNIVVYNPVKGAQITAEIKKHADDIEWVPIENMNVEQVRQLLRTAKVYVDFGEHPGKDRIPREAAVSGCVIITGREGAAAYKADVPIPDEYKFASPIDQAEDIMKLVKDIFMNYEDHYRRFDYYIRMIKSEKAWFEQDVDKLIQRVMGI
ncbi:hypothetical protein SAMN02910292_00685 [Lachnospiraceae bacterium XBB2008]|nr:hypothetical protein SAMN02910292_00685 [Lachnospiraceae bacterium XBB2008]